MHRVRQIVQALKGRWHGTYGMVRCLAHEDRTPSLSITEVDGQLLMYCHAGCSQAQVMSAVRASGLWQCRVNEPQNRKQSSTCSTGNIDKNNTTGIAKQIWQECRDAIGTIVERYLQSRGVSLPPAGAEAIRFHPALKHPSGATWPAMVAAITDVASAELIGIHRTFLDPVTAGKAPVTPQKMILGRKRGGVIRLVADDEVGRRIGYAEGIETALSAIAGGWSCWAGIDAGNLASLPVWPSMDLTVFVDHDPAGIAAGEAIARRWIGAGGNAVIVKAPLPGTDWNDEAAAAGAAP